MKVRNHSAQALMPASSEIETSYDPKAAVIIAITWSIGDG